jgi:uncharacterized DUF497 family protein
MLFEWDEKKSLKNARERGFPFDLAEAMDFDTAVFEEDIRKDYGERRFVVYGLIGNRLYILCFTPINGGFRVISLRKANQREVKYYEQEIQTIDK